MDGLKLRRMLEDDVPVLTAIVAANYSPRFAEQFVPEALCAFFHYPFRPHFIVGQLDDAVVGCGCWTTDWASWGCFTLSWVQVSPSLQGRGIGRAIVAALLDELRPQATLVTLATTKPAYYARHWGFETIKKYPSNEGEQYSMMALDLKALSS